MNSPQAPPPPPLVYYCYPCGKSWKPPQDLQWRKSPTKDAGGTWVSVVDLEDTHCPDCGYSGRAMRSVEDLVEGEEDPVT